MSVHPSQGSHALRRVLVFGVVKNQNPCEGVRRNEQLRSRENPRKGGLRVASLVMASLDSAGRAFTLYGRSRAHQARYGVGERNYNSTAGEASKSSTHTTTSA